MASGLILNKRRNTEVIASYAEASPIHNSMKRKHNHHSVSRNPPSTPRNLSVSSNHGM